MPLRLKTLPALVVGFTYAACMSSSALAGFLNAVESVPTLDEYGLIALAGLLAVAGGVTLARRNRKK